MSARRPHWSNDLIDAVFRALSHTYRAQGWTGGIAIDLDESVYPLIAAVEDWQDANGLGRIGLLLGQRQSAINERIEAEAAIQRVREVLERYRTSPYSEMSQTDALGAVGRALDGGAE